LQDRKYILAMTLLAFALAAPEAKATILMNDPTGIPSNLVSGANLQSMGSGTVSLAVSVTSFDESAHPDRDNAFGVNCLALIYQFGNVGSGHSERDTVFAFTGLRVGIGDDTAADSDPPDLVDPSLNRRVGGSSYKSNNDTQPEEPGPAIEIMQQEKMSDK